MNNIAHILFVGISFLVLDTDRIIGAFIELLMADNTRMKEIQGELKRI